MTSEHLKMGIQCEECCTTFSRSDNLKRHRLSQHKNKHQVDGVGVGEKRSASTVDTILNKNPMSSTLPEVSGSGKWSKNVLTAHVKTSNDEKKNPRIQELVDEIVNNGVTFSKPSLEDSAKTDEPAAKKLKSTNKVVGENGDDTNESNDDDTDHDDDEDDDEDGDESNSDTDISDSPSSSPHKVKSIPRTLDGLRASFKALLQKIAVDRKYGRGEKTADRAEAVVLLDELNRRGCISPDLYTDYKYFLSEDFENGPNEEKDNDENTISADVKDTEEKTNQLKDIIISIADYLTKHDKNELLDIVNELKKHEEIVDVITELEKLIGLYLEDDFIDGESIVGKIHELVERCLADNKHVPRSAALKIKALVNTIAKNRHRIEEIFNRFSQVGEDQESRLWILKQLVKEKHLSDDQYLRLFEMGDEINLKELTDVVKQTKIGQGLSFLPRKTTALLDNLREWLLEFTEKGGQALQSKVLSLLNELLQRRVISQERYNEIKEENDLL